MAFDPEAVQQLEEHRRVWEKKPVLRRIYREEFFARLVSHRREPGVSVEIGGGPGFFKKFFPEVVSTDLVWRPWLDLAADAQVLPFRSESVANLMGLDILHHLASPTAFLKEVERVLVIGGRLILIETWVTPFSYLVYRYFHQEDCDLKARPLEKSPFGEENHKKAFEGNQAIPYLLFGPKTVGKTLAVLPRLKVLTIEPFSLFAYLLSFGFKPVSLLPEALYPAVSALEKATLPLWRRLASLRALIVLEKK